MTSFFIKATARRSHLIQRPNGRYQWILKDCRGNYKPDNITYKYEYSANGLTKDGQIKFY